MITLIIIIILATVTIIFAFNGGIIEEAERASDMYANDTAYTDASLANVTAYLGERINDTNGGETDDPQNPDSTPNTVEEAKEKERHL